MVRCRYLQCEGVDGDVHGLRGRRVHVSLKEHLTRLQHCGDVVPSLLCQEGTSHHLQEKQNTTNRLKKTTKTHPPAKISVLKNTHKKTNKQTFKSLMTAVICDPSAPLFITTSHCVVMTRAGASARVRSATNTTSGFLIRMFISVFDATTGAAAEEVKDKNDSDCEEMVSSAVRQWLLRLTGLFGLDRGVGALAAGGAPRLRRRLLEALLHGIAEDAGHGEQELHAGAQVHVLYQRFQQGALTSLAVVHLHHGVLLGARAQCNHPGGRGQSRVRAVEEKCLSFFLSISFFVKSPWCDHLHIGSLVIQKTGVELDGGLHGVVGEHVDGGGDGAQSELGQLQLLVVRIQRQQLHQMTHSRDVLERIHCAQLSLCACVARNTEFSLGVNSTSVIESNLQSNLSAIFSLLVLCASTTAAVTTVLPAQSAKCFMAPMNTSV